MRIGIIAEGKGDLGVISQILKGITGLDTSNFQHLRPSDEYDETDLNTINRTWSTWSLVKKECESGDIFDEFFGIEDNKYIVIHIDSDRSSDYDVVAPQKGRSYCIELRSLIVQKIKSWLNGKFIDNILFAVAIEEIEAWLLTIYNTNPPKITADKNNPKKALSFSLNKINEDTTSNYENYKRLSKPFSKKNDVKTGKFLEYNCSLKLFYNEVEVMWNKESNLN